MIPHSGLTSRRNAPDPAGLGRIYLRIFEWRMKQAGIPRLDTLSANSRLPLTDPVPLPSSAEGPASAVLEVNIND